jgi:hypothetical protein
VERADLWDARSARRRQAVWRWRAIVAYIATGERAPSRSLEFDALNREASHASRLIECPDGGGFYLGSPCDGHMMLR